MLSATFTTSHLGSRDSSASSLKVIPFTGLDDDDEDELDFDELEDEDDEEDKSEANRSPTNDENSDESISKQDNGSSVGDDEGSRQPGGTASKRRENFHSASPRKRRNINGNNSDHSGRVSAADNQRNNSMPSPVDHQHQILHNNDLGQQLCEENPLHLGNSHGLLVLSTPSPEQSRLVTSSSSTSQLQDQDIQSQQPQGHQHHHQSMYGGGDNQHQQQHTQHLHLNHHYQQQQYYASSPIVGQHTTDRQHHIQATHPIHHHHQPHLDHLATIVPQAPSGTHSTIAGGSLPPFCTLRFD